MAPAAGEWAIRDRRRPVTAPMAAGATRPTTQRARAGSRSGHGRVTTACRWAVPPLPARVPASADPFGGSRVQRQREEPMTIAAPSTSDSE